MRKTAIYVWPNLAALAPVIQSALEELVLVEFKSAEKQQTRDAENRYHICISPELPASLVDSGIQRRILHLRTVPPRNPVPAGKVRFLNAPQVDLVLRGRTLNHEDITELCSLEDLGAADIVASLDGRPIWVQRHIHDHTIDVVAGPIPHLNADSTPSDILRAFYFHPLLPILHFVRECAGTKSWSRPKARACLMFDDPNLHWPTYGYVDYAELAGRAVRDNFRVSFATVPADSWIISQKTADLFRGSQDRLCLLLHGNDHLREELGRPGSADAKLRMFAQSIRRIRKLERKAGISVSRMMAPPHEACTEASMRAMLQMGIEGACISTWSLKTWNPRKSWNAGFGLHLAELLAGGFPATPRFRMSEDCEDVVVMLAFLGRAIIPVGHHYSIAEGPDLLSQIAKRINSINGSHWITPAEILRSNFLQLQIGATLYIKPYAALISLKVPDDVNSLVLDLSHAREVAPRFKVSEVPARNDDAICVGDAESVYVHSGSTVEIRLLALGSTDPDSVSRPRRSLWVYPRRLLCESRDRVSPIVSRIAKTIRPSRK